jgi:RNA methyltransferase, TrmH family
MPVRTVESKQNARLKDLRRALATPGRGRDGSLLVAIEGPILIAEALRANLRIDSVFVAQGAEKLLAPLPLPPDTEILLFPRSVLLSALTTENPQPIAALVEPVRWSWKQAIALPPSQPQFLLVLAGLQDPGNLGTILRSAEAFGATGVISLPGTVSEWNPKTLRAAAGSVFRLPIVHGVLSALLQLREMGVQILAATARSGLPANTVDLTQPIALLIGNEGNGLPQELVARADAAITIPCPGPVESLNAAVAAGVLLYEAARQRSNAAHGAKTKRSVR